MWLPNGTHESSSTTAVNRFVLKLSCPRLIVLKKHHHTTHRKRDEIKASPLDRADELICDQIHAPRAPDLRQRCPAAPSERHPGAHGSSAALSLCTCNELSTDATTTSAPALLMTSIITTAWWAHAGNGSMKRGAEICCTPPSPLCLEQ